MGCFRIKSSDLSVCEVAEKSCRKSNVRFDEAIKVAKLFKKHGNLKLIEDGKFLVGSFCDGKAIGKRIDVLPDGVKLNKGFSLFASKLTIHDEKSRGHWDAIFENPNGSFSYLYSLDKIKASKKKKFNLVNDFEKRLPRLRKNLMRALGESDLVLAMLVLLKTKMRVGSEIYYKRNKHKGLTTLKKKNVKIKGDKVYFDFVGKDGVPQTLAEVFEGKVLDELKKILKKKKSGDFVFLNSNGKVFRDVEFEAGFERFCGERFYPHIVRSHFATREVEKFLKRAKFPSKEKTKAFCSKIAEELGHKKFSKKDELWKASYEVTLHYYVRPDLVEKIKKFS